MLPGVPGALDVRAPASLRGAHLGAAAAEATVVRGVGDVDIEPRDASVVRYEHDDIAHELRCRLIVGADGRMSTVRRHLGVEFTRTRRTSGGGGMLVDGLDAWPTRSGTEGDLLYYMFPRANGRATVLTARHRPEGRFSGLDRHAMFLAAFGLRCIPGSEMFRAAHPAGPCAFYPMNDSWIDQPTLPVSS